MSLRTISYFERLLGPLRRRIMAVVARGVVKLVHNSLKMQTLQVNGFKGETMDGVEFFENYGFTAYPFDDAECLLVFPQGNREHGIAIAVADRRYRLVGLEMGEVALYTDEGDSIILRRGNRIEVNTELAVFSKDVTIDGELIVKGKSFLRNTVALENADLIQTGISPEFRTTGSVLVETLISCELNVVGNTASSTISFNSIRNSYNAHTHNGNVPVPILQM